MTHKYKFLTLLFTHCFLQAHAEQSLALKQVILYGSAHYNTLLYRTLYQQDQLGLLQVAMLAQLTAHVVRTNFIMHFFASLK